MLDPNRTITLATRGSALALAQTHLILELCRKAFPQLRFDYKVIKTTGDKLQTASLANPQEGLPKGLFTKELEVALIEGQADIAVHSLKDLPTDLPAGLKLAATPRRADVRDVLVYRDQDWFSNPENHRKEGGTPGQSALRGLQQHAQLKDFPKGATIATSSTRRKAQLLVARPDLKVVEIRGNVPTRLKKIAEREEYDGTILALAGLNRLNFTIDPNGKLKGEAVPNGVLATVLDETVMLPCVGQGAIGIEARADDERIAKICERLNDYHTFQAVTAERAFLATMGGGCQSPVAAYAEIVGESISMRAVSFRDGPAKFSSGKASIKDASALGEKLAAKLK